MIKTCATCKKSLSVKDFNKDRATKDGLNYLCKSCKKIKRKIYDENSKTKISTRTKKYYLDHKEELKKYGRKYYKEHKLQFNETCRLWREKNKEKLKARYIEYNKKHRKRIQQKHNQYVTNRSKIDLSFKLSNSLRSRLCSVIKLNSKTGSAVKDLGCTIKELKQYLEKQFQPEMTWENWSFRGWHIDHIIPLCKFNLTKRKEFLKAVHYTNLRPLWAKDNLSKGRSERKGGKI